jgi:hypothetical protein
VLHKYLDLDGNGRYDPGEPPLAGIRLDITVGGQVYSGETDDTGTLRMCFPGDVTVEIGEATRANGGQWRLTTDPGELSFRLGCGTSERWLGNAQLGMPLTGRGDGHGRRWPALGAGLLAF